VALLACLVGMVLWRRDRWSLGLAAGSVVAVLLVLAVMPSELMHRGMSYRPQIFRQALAFIEAHPWSGLGLGSDYRVIAGSQVLTHSHNIFTNVAIEVGLPGLVLWLLVWAWMGWQGWRHRRQSLGALMLVTWIFASVALQVDGPSFLQSPRAEWLVTWLPLAIALQLWFEDRGKGTAQKGRSAV
jgi:O-antigen ligase